MSKIGECKKINKPVIKWQKAYNPFKSLDKSDVPKPEDESTYKDEMTDEQSVYDLLPEPNEKKGVDVMVTPLGFFPVNEDTDIYTHFNLWIGHTNFGITKSICDIIEGVEGVELLNVFTRYRFRIGVGKLFKAPEVSAEIGKRIRKHFGRRAIT